MNPTTKYSDCIEACQKCSTACGHCANSNLKEDDVKMMARCTQLCMECATLCDAASRLMSINGTQVRELCFICAITCDECAQECSKHPRDHCRRCAEACKRCAEECRKMTA